METPTSKKLEAKKVTLEKFEASTCPQYPGCALDSSTRQWVSIIPDEKEITKAIDELRLEAAKNAIYHRYGTFTANTLKGLLKIVQKLVELNEKPLSEEHEALNYTLADADSLSCQMYMIAFNINRRPLSPLEGSKSAQMAFVVRALELVSDAYVSKNDFCNAVDSLGRLDDCDLKGPVNKILKQWESYIKNECPASEKDRQEFLYQYRMRALKTRTLEIH